MVKDSENFRIRYTTDSSGAASIQHLPGNYDVLKIDDIADLHELAELLVQVCGDIASNGGDDI